VAKPLTFRIVFGSVVWAYKWHQPGCQNVCWNRLCETNDEQSCMKDALSWWRNCHEILWITCNSAYITQADISVPLRCVSNFDALFLARLFKLLLLLLV